MGYLFTIILALLVLIQILTVWYMETRGKSRMSIDLMMGLFLPIYILYFGTLCTYLLKNGP